MTFRRAPFVKMSGAGNDFILLDASRLKALRLAPRLLARRLCDRHGGVGADGLLILGRKGRGFRLSHYNSDGSEAFCANGSRCAAWFLHARGMARNRCSLETKAGLIQAEITGKERVRLSMPPLGNMRLGQELRAAGRHWIAHSIDTGVPHAVVEVRGLDAFPVEAAGRALRKHRAFAPAGTNVDFIAITKKRSGKPAVHLRTYERGVEAETLACGTGAVAAAVCAHFLKGIRPPIRVAAAGGDILTVHFNPQGARISDLWLEGPARITFTGETLL